MAIALLWPVAQHFRIDQVRCDSWPAPLVRQAVSLYLLAVGLLFSFGSGFCRRRANRAFFRSGMRFSPRLAGTEPRCFARRFYRTIRCFIWRLDGCCMRNIRRCMRRSLTCWVQAMRSCDFCCFALASRHQRLSSRFPRAGLAGRIASGSFDRRSADGVPKSVGAGGACDDACVCAPGGPLRQAGGLRNDAVWAVTACAFGRHAVGAQRCLAGVFAGTVGAGLAVVASRALPTWALLGLLVKLSAMLPLLTMTLSHAVPFVRRHKRWIALCLVLGLTVLAFLWRFPPFPQLKGHLTSVLFRQPRPTLGTTARALSSVCRDQSCAMDWIVPTGRIASGWRFDCSAGCGLLRVACRQNPLSATAWGLLSYYLFWHGWAQTWYFLPVFAAAAVSFQTARTCARSAVRLWLRVLCARAVSQLHNRAVAGRRL